MDQDAHIAFSSVEVINENVTRICFALGPSLTIGKLDVGSGSEDWDQVRIELKGLIRLRRNSVAVKHQNGLDQRYNVSSNLAVTDIGLGNADNKRLRTLGLDGRCKDILHCRCFDTITRPSTCALHFDNIDFARTYCCLT